MRNRRLLLALLVPVLGLALVIMLEPRDPLTDEPGGAPHDIVRVSNPGRTAGSEPNSIPADIAHLTPGVRESAARSVAVQGGGDRLRPLHALLVHAETGVPIRFLAVKVTDSNGVGVEAISDADGRLESGELLLAGPASVAIRIERLPFASWLNWTHAKQRTVDLRSQTVQHGRGEGADHWEIEVGPRLSIHVLGADLKSTRVAAYVTAESPSGYTVHEFRPTPELGPSHGLVAVSPAFSLAERNRDPLNTPDRARLLHVVGTTTTTVAVGTVRFVESPPGALLPVDVTLLRLTRADESTLDERFGPPLATVLRRLLHATARYLEDRIHAETDTGIAIAGTVLSQTGGFRGALRIRAFPTMLNTPGALHPVRMGEAKVLWSNDGVGRFVIENLDATTYRLAPVASTHILTRPAKRAVDAPFAFPLTGPAAFLVLDDLEMQAVAVRVQASDGSWLGGFDAQLTATFESDTIEYGTLAPLVPDSAEPPVPAVVARAVPAAAEFEVKVSLRGYETDVLRRADFQLSEGTLHATATLRITAGKIAEDRVLREMRERDF